MCLKPVPPPVSVIVGAPPPADVNVALLLVVSINPTATHPPSGSAATLWPFARRGDGRFARFHRHEVIGATLLRGAGSDPATVSLVGEFADAPAPAAEALRWADDL